MVEIKVQLVMKDWMNEWTFTDGSKKSKPIKEGVN